MLCEICNNVVNVNVVKGMVYINCRNCATEQVCNIKTDSDFEYTERGRLDDKDYLTSLGFVGKEYLKSQKYR